MNRLWLHPRAKTHFGTIKAQCTVRLNNRKLWGMRDMKCDLYQPRVNPGTLTKNETESKGLPSSFDNILVYAEKCYEYLYHLYIAEGKIMKKLKSTGSSASNLIGMTDRN